MQLGFVVFVVVVVGYGICYLMPGNRPHDDLGRLLSFKLSAKLLFWSFPYDLISILLLVFVMRRCAIGLVGSGE